MMLLICFVKVNCFLKPEIMRAPSYQIYKELRKASVNKRTISAIIGFYGAITSMNKDGFCGAFPKTCALWHIGHWYNGFLPK